MNKNNNDRLDELEAELSGNFPAVDCPLVHRFAGGMYIREIFMPKGTYIVSLTHLFEHPFFVLQGEAIVYSDNDGEQVITAPYIGITQPYTRRVLYINEDCIWATCHKTDIKPKDDSEESVLYAVSKVLEEVIEDRDNGVLGGKLINNTFIPNPKLITIKS